MSERTAIEWTRGDDGSPGATWNPVRGCDKVSPGCKNCYAETLAERFRGVPGHPYERGFDIRLVPEKLGEPTRWRRPRRVFVNSMSDLFHPGVPDEYVAACFGVMAACERHTFMVLTKRAGRMSGFAQWMLAQRGGFWASQWAYAIATANLHVAFPRDLQLAWEPPQSDEVRPNIWLGVSVEDRKYGIPRIDALRRTPAAVRFLSVEPLLEDVADDLELDGIDWVIVGGESGPGARPMHPDWVRRIRDLCVKRGVAFFFKQWGAWKPISEMSESETEGYYDPVPEHRTGEPRRCRVQNRAVGFDGGDHWWRVRGYPSYLMFRVGKKRAGNHLDGRVWDEMPAAAEEGRHGA